MSNLNFELYKKFNGQYNRIFEQIKKKTKIRKLDLRQITPFFLKKMYIFIRKQHKGLNMSNLAFLLNNTFKNIPEFCQSHWLLRIPLAVIFIQQGLMKLPLDIAEAESYGLSYLTWWVVAYGELGAGLGLIVGGLLNIKLLEKLQILGDLITRFSGFTIGCITTGVIWIGEPESLIDIILYDNLHVLLWVGGLFFALRGSKA